MDLCNLCVPTCDRGRTEIAMNNQQLIDEYTKVLNDFTKKLVELDKEHGTYLRFEVVNRAVCNIVITGDPA